MLCSATGCTIPICLEFYVILVFFCCCCRSFLLVGSSIDHHTTYTLTLNRILCVAKEKLCVNVAQTLELSQDRNIRIDRLEMKLKEKKRKKMIALKLDELCVALEKKNP